MSLLGLDPCGGSMVKLASSVKPTDDKWKGWRDFQPYLSLSLLPDWEGLDLAILYQVLPRTCGYRRVARVELKTKEIVDMQKLLEGSDCTASVHCNKFCTCPPSGKLMIWSLSMDPHVAQDKKFCCAMHHCTRCDPTHNANRFSWLWRCNIGTTNHNIT
jgi:hypothetical protein